MFHKIWEAFSHCIFKCLFFLSLLRLGCPQCVCRFTGWRPTHPSDLSAFLQAFFFLFLRLHHFHCSIFQFADCFFCVLKSAFEFLVNILFQLMYFWAPEFLFCFFLGFCFIDIFTFSYITFLTFSTPSFSSLSIFKTIIVKSLSKDLPSDLFTEIVSVGLFFPWNGSYILACVPCDFFVFVES